MEIAYHIKSPEGLLPVEIPEDVTVRWLEFPLDYDVFKTHLMRQAPDRVLSIDEWEAWQTQGIDYCGLFAGDIMVARAAVKRHSTGPWEIADVRVLMPYRGLGYARMVCWFAAKTTLERGHEAVVRVEEGNTAMQHVIEDLGFTLCDMP